MPMGMAGNYGKTLLPGLRKIFFETYKEKPEQYPLFCNVETMDSGYIEDARMGGFGLWHEKGTLDSTTYQTPEGFATIGFTPKTFSDGFVIEKEWIDDEKYNLINRFPKNLGRTARVSIEIFAAGLLNNAFTASASNFGGEALIASDHDLLGAKGSTTTNLIGALALSEANLETGCKLAGEQVDENGLKIQMAVDTLIVPTALQFTAEKIMRTIQEVGTANNTVNVVRNRIKKLVVLDYLTDANNWFLMDSTMNPLTFRWRERLNFKHETDFDTDAYKYKGRYRIQAGWTDFRGILGSNPS